MPEAALLEAIDRGCTAMNCTVATHTRDRLAAYLDLLAHWNRVFNLTAVRDPQAMVARHLLDSLTLLPYLTGTRCIDVGTGAGLPGIPLSLVRPDCRWTLLDASAKKMRFVRQAVAELQIDNVECICQRMQEYRPAQPFDMVISRAVAGIPALYAQTHHLLRPGGRFLYMKGARPDREIADFAAPAPIHIERVRVPDVDAERHLVWFEQPG